MGLSGRIGVGVALFAVIADGITWLVRAIDNYPFGFYRQIDVYLPVVFLFGLALLLPSISLAIQTRRAANLAKFPLTSTGPLPPGLRLDADQVVTGEGASHRSASGGQIPPPKLAFVPLPSLRKLFQRVSRVFFLLAIMSVPMLTTSLDWELPFYLLAAAAFIFHFWPDVREAEELSLQGETRATYRGVARAHLSRPRLNPVMKPLPHLRAWSYTWFMVLFVVWIIFSIITRLTPTGLMVYVPKPGTYAQGNEPWNVPLVVRVDAQRHLYLNRQPAQFADLGPRLLRALSVRADWTVFVDGAPDGNAGDVITVTDTIHGIGGTKVFLVTPSMKKEKPQLAMTPPCESKAPHPPDLRLPLNWREHRFYEYPDVAFVVGESGKVSNVKIQRKGDLPEFTEWLVRSAHKLKYPPAPGCGEHQLSVGYSW